MAAAAEVVMVAGPEALCSIGSHSPASTLPAFEFGPSFWLLVASPAASLALFAYALWSC